MTLFLDTNICLDLLDTSRPTSSQTVDWYCLLYTSPSPRD